MVIEILSLRFGHISHHRPRPAVRVLQRKREAVIIATAIWSSLGDLAEGCVATSGGRSWCRTLSAWTLSPSAATFGATPGERGSVGSKRRYLARRRRSKFEAPAASRPNCPGTQLSSFSFLDGTWYKSHQEAMRVHISQLKVGRYRGLFEFALEDLGRVNLLVGANNSGVLESRFRYRFKTTAGFRMKHLKSRVWSLCKHFLLIFWHHRNTRIE